MTKAHKVYQPLTSISELYLLPKNYEWHRNYNRGLLQGIAVGWPFRLACKVVESLLRSLPVFNCVFKYKICLYQDYTHLSVKGYPAHSKHVPKLTQSRVISQPFSQRIAKDIRHRSRRCLVATVVPSAAFSAFSLSGLHRCNARTPFWHLGLRSVFWCVYISYCTV